MNYKESIGEEHIPDFINLEEYNNLLGELEHLEENQLSQSEIELKLKTPEIIIETIKLIAGVFYRIPTKEYLEHCILSSVMADFDRLLQHHICYERVYKLIKKIDGERKC